VRVFDKIVAAGDFPVEKTLIGNGEVHSRIDPHFDAVIGVDNGRVHVQN
jgi:hypothetical protein